MLQEMKGVAKKQLRFRCTSNSLKYMKPRPKDKTSNLNVMICQAK